MNTKYMLPGTVPLQDPPGLWQLQIQLLAIAESLLGTRDVSKQICQPRFCVDGPQIRHTPAKDGVYVELAGEARNRWDFVLFQMAHETVHLLNPIVGDAKVLEEGVASEFSRYVQQCFVTSTGHQIRIMDNLQSYIDAARLVRMLPGGPLRAAKRIRNYVRDLESISVPILEKLFPHVDKTILSNLNKRFDRSS